MQFASLSHHIRRKIQPYCVSTSFSRGPCDVPRAGRYIQSLCSVFYFGGIKQGFAKVRCEGAKTKVVLISRSIPSRLLKVSE